MAIAILDKEIQVLIDKIAEELDRFQTTMVVRISLNLIMLLFAFLIYQFNISNQIPLFIISLMYLLMVIWFLNSVIKNMKFYIKNKEIIHQYASKYLALRKKNNHKETVILIVKEIIVKEIDGGLDKKIKQKRVKEFIGKFIKKTKKPQEFIDSLGPRAYEILALKMNKQVMKKMILNGLNFAVLIAIVLLANRFVIGEFYQGNIVYTMIYPFVHIFKAMMASM
jgi:ABC-type multidrug transport system fused ATPase/permease subunit